MPKTRDFTLTAEQAAQKTRDKRLFKNLLLTAEQAAQKQR